VREQLIEEIERLRQEVDKLRQEKTERKHAKEALEASEERLRSLLENIPDFVITVDHNHKILMINRGIPGIVTVEQAIGTEVYNYVEPAHHEIMKESLEKVFQTGMPERYEVLGMGPEGPDTAWYETRVSPNKLDGQVISVTLISSDITKRKKAEEEVATEKKKSENYVESIADGLCVNNTNGTITQVNEAFIRMFGYKSPEEVIGKTIFENVAKREIPKITKRFTETVKNEESGIKDFEVICLGTDGSEFPVSFNIRNLWESKKYVGSISTARDITERKRAEQELESERKKLESYIESMVDGVVISDLTGTTVDINKACLELLGYKRKEDVVGRPGFIRAIRKKDMPKIVALLEEIIKKGYVRDREITVLAQDRREIPILFSATLIKDPAGKPTSIFTIFKDITERKQAEAQIRELSSVVEQSIDGIATGDLEPKLTYVNDAFARMHGYSPAEMVGMPVANLHSEEQMDEFQKGIDHIKTVGSWIGEIGHVRKDGTPFPTHMSVTLLTDEQGKPTGIATVCRDITERKQHEKEYKQLIDGMNDTIFVIDFKGKFLDVNDTAIETLGYSRTELLTMGPVDIDPYLSPDDIGKLIEGMKLDERQVFESQHRTKDGKIIPVEISSSPVSYQGKAAILSVARDITERKKAEETLKKSEEQYRSLFESATDGIFTMDLQTRFTSGNRKAEEMCGYSRDELIGKYATIILPEEEIPRMADALKKVLKGKIDTYETRIITKNGELLPVEVTSSPIEIDGKIIGIMGTARDITERKQAEETLKESEEKFRTFVDTAGDLMNIADKDGYLTDVNAAIARVLGYSKKELIGMHITQILTKEAVERDFKPNWERFMKRGKISLDTTYATKDGKEIYGELKAVAVCDSDGKYAGGRAVFHDLTERKLAELASEEARTRFEDLFETANELIITTDPEGWILHVNKEVEKLSGFSKEELIGQSILEIAHPEDVPKYIQFWKDILSGLAPRYELRSISKKKPGKMRYLLASGSVVKKDGKIVEIQYNAKDITEEKQAEEKLRESERKYRTILENMTEGYYEVDLAGNFTFFNDAMCQILGYTRHEMMGINNRQYMDKENAKKVYQMFNKVYTTGKPSSGFDWQFIKKDGTKRFVETSVSLIRDVAGKPTGFRGILRDITERKETEAERKMLEQRAQVASRLSTMGEMASGIVHEINNPLTSVIGFAQLLTQQDLPKDAREYATIINNEGHRVASIACRILDFARHEKPERVYADINHLIESTIELQAYEMEAANIKVTTQLDPHLPRTTADAGQLQQVFLNIILNAKMEMQSAHGKGKFLVKTEAIDNTIRISFEDNGPGIPKKNLERIFEPFFTTKEVGTATGLGLSICHEIIANHNGQIYARSTPEKGATFIIELPVVARQRKTATTARANASIV
jgi:PAS domain S-box-containing protein